jgi:hypothetical protein
MVDLLKCDLGVIPIGPQNMEESADSNDDYIEHNISFSLSNHNSTSFEIVGSENECGKNACVSVNQLGRIVVKPGATVQIPCTVYVKRSQGQFTAGGLLHVDVGGLRTIRLSVYGTAIVYK